MKPKTSMLKSKKGILENLNALAIGIVTFGITIVIVLLIMSNLAANTQVTADANATAAVQASQEAASDITDWLALIVIVTIGALILFLVRRFG